MSSMPRSITVGKMFELVDLLSKKIQDEEDADRRRVSLSIETQQLEQVTLDIDGAPREPPDAAGDIEAIPRVVTSHDLQAYFKKHGIVPTEHYSEYFSDQKPTIALTYEWNTSFNQIKAFLDEANVAEHNRRVNPRLPLKDGCYMMSGAWLCFGPLRSCSIPRKIAATTIWIDILFNNQLLEQDIENELAAAEKAYREAGVHVVLGTRRVLGRAWCLFEIAVRREAGKMSQVLMVRTRQEGCAAIDQMPDMSVAVGALLSGIVFTACAYPSVSKWVTIVVWRVLFCADLAFSEAFAGGENVDPGLSVMMQSFSSEVKEYAISDFFELMKASLERDKAAIQDKILQTFKSAVMFNSKLAAAAVKADVSYAVAALVLWLELLLQFVLLPAGLVGGAMGFLLALLVPARCIGCISNVDREIDNYEKMGCKPRRWASFILAWQVLEAMIKLVISGVTLSALALPVGLVWLLFSAPCWLWKRSRGA